MRKPEDSLLHRAAVLDALAFSTASKNKRRVKGGNFTFAFRCAVRQVVSQERHEENKMW
jgi:hypothetical protein